MKEEDEEEKKSNNEGEIPNRILRRRNGRKGKRASIINGFCDFCLEIAQNP